MSEAKYTPEEIISRLELKPVTQYQSEIISSPLEPSVVIAGAGSGKTETMSNRVLYLVANGFVTPDQILGLTFTRKAAGELSVRIRKRLRQLAAHKDFKHITSTSTSVTTYHSYAGKLLSEHAIRYGIDADAEPLGEAAIWQIASDVVRNWSDDSYRNDSAVSTVIKDLLGLSKFMLEHQVNAADIEVIGNEMLVKLHSLAGSTNEETRAVARAMRSPLGVGASRFHTGGLAGAVDTVYLGVFRKEALILVGGFDERFTRAQDWELNYRLRKNGGLIWFDPRLQVTYRPRSSFKKLANSFKVVVFPYCLGLFIVK